MSENLQSSVNSTQSDADNGTLSVASEQPDGINQGEHLYGFFAIGVTINIVMIVAYFIWAYRQWHKKNRDTPSPPGRGQG